MIKDTIKKYLEKKYHKNHKRAANAALLKIESWNGKTNKTLLRQSNEYSIEVLGSKKYAPWLYVYSAISNEFKEGWIPDNYYGKVVIPALKNNYGELSNLRALQGLIFQNDGFPDLFYRINGLWLDHELKVRQAHQIEDYLKGKNTKIIIKADGSSQGRGIQILEGKNFDFSKISISGNFVIQDYISQHPFFDDFSNTSVATLRITSFIDTNGEVSIRGAYLRIGRQSDSFVKSKTAIKIGVDIHSGELHKNGYTPEWILITKHPDTNTDFKYKTIPLFEECVRTVKRLHSKVPFARVIGWDLVVDENDKIKVMEWNGSHNDIKFSEAVQGPIFEGLGFEKLHK